MNVSQTERNSDNFSKNPNSFSLWFGSLEHRLIKPYQDTLYPEYFFWFSKRKKRNFFFFFFWKLKSRITWLTQGDANIKFFHALMTLQRRSFNTISTLWDRCSVCLFGYKTNLLGIILLPSFEIYLQSSQPFLSESLPILN